MATLRIFAISLVFTALALIAALVYGGPKALLLVAVLGTLEVSLSFDNAVLNANILRRMSRFWQRIFLTVGILIAVFGMRLLFPLLIVWITAGMAPVDAFQLAMNPPTDGRPTYEDLMSQAHHQIAAFGGTFLLMLFLDFILNNRKLKWLNWIEEPLARIGRLDQLPGALACASLLVVASVLAKDEQRSSVMIAGVLGFITYLVIKGFTTLFHPPGESDDDESASPTQSGPGRAATATGKAGFFLFLYLEVLDSTFSFDGVIGAFAITADPIIITLGLGLIGAMFVRSITIFFVRKGTLNQYEYLEHGAHWAIGALAVILLISVGHHVPEVVTALVGLTVISAAFLSSVVRNRRRGKPKERESGEIESGTASTSVPKPSPA
jgi:hypothetical protein